MKLKIALVFALAIGLICCQNKINDVYQSSGKITGPDLRMCMCCGGWLIEIDHEIYNFESLPSDSPITLEKETFPLLVKLDWKMSGENHCSRWITIGRIKKD